MATSDEARPDQGEDPGPRLSVAAVARRLGVAPSTLRTWDRRYGLGPSSHQAGAHRRYTAADLERLVVMRRLTLEGVQPAEAARIAMTIPRSRAVQPRAVGSPPPPGASPATAGPGSSAPARPPATSPARPDLPEGVVGLPIAHPPPRVKPVPQPGRTIPAARAARAPVTSAPIGALRELRPADRASSSERLARAVGAPSSGSAIMPGSAELAAALDLPAELGSRAELGLFAPRAPDGADGGGSVDGPAEAGRCGGGRVLALADATPQARGLARAAMALDSPEVARILGEAVEAHGVLAAWNGLAVPVLHAVGERWRATGEVVDVEHLFSQTLEDVLRGVIARTRPPRRPSPLLLACLEKEHHTLPLQALAAALAERGVSSRLLGGGMPSSSLVNAVRRTGPALVFLYAHLPVRDGAVLADLPRQRPAPRVVVGGPGWPDGIPAAGVRQVTSLGGAVDEVLAAVRA